MTVITVPNITAEMSTLDAASAYAAAGFYVGPARRGTKHPGSVIGDNWEAPHTSRDPDLISSWFAGTDHGVFLHAGRSGLVIFDVDNPERLHPAIAQAVEQFRPPCQSTRPDQPDRRHYLFLMPPGRDLGNSLGELVGGWGQIRGRNGVIIVAPSEHEEPDGRYAWHQTGPVPVLPGYVASRLPDALDAAEAATDAQVTAFLAEHGTETRRELLDIHVAAFTKKSRPGSHDTTR